MIYPIAPSGIFWTLQGEGALSGEPMAFIRLAGCSVGCKDCDTDYSVAERLSIEDIIKRVRSIIPSTFTWPWIWITGGEPTDHNLQPLTDLLQTVGFRVALATAGVKDVMPLKLQWISVSPHSPIVMQKTGHEIKVVPGLNGLSWDTISNDISRWSFPYRFIQPFWENQRENNIVECIDFVKSNPGWRLSSQAHKGWRLP